MDGRAIIITLVAVTLLNVCLAVHKLQVIPTTFGVGLTKRLEVRCSFTREASSLISTLISLSVAHSSEVDNPVFSVIATIVYNDNKLKGPALTHASNVTGNLNNSGESFIKITWNYPMKFNSGRYRCKAHGINDLGSVLDSIQGQIVTAEAPSIRSVVLELINLNKKYEQMQSSFADYVDAEKSRVNISASLRTQFDVSEVFNNRRYYLNTRTNAFTANDAHFRCHMYGGYLAEVDDANEFEFIRSFLNLKAKNFVEVLIGGSDEAVEGKWMYTYSNKPVLSLGWTSGEPNGGKNINNLCFWKNSGFYMSDCVMRMDSSYTFLCEIPESSIP